MPNQDVRGPVTATSTPYYPQLAERDCGATCLRMVAEHYGVRTSMARLREVTRTTDSGTDLGGIETGARALGFETLAAELPYDELAAGDLLPAILHWDRDHFVVIASADEYSANVLDPAAGARRLTRAEFEAHRYGPGRSRAGLVVRPSAGPSPEQVGDSPSKIAAATGSPGGTELESELNGRSSLAAEEVEAPGAQPRPLALTALVVAGVVIIGAMAYVALTAITQAVDLQFREAWPRHLGGMLLAVAGVGLWNFLLRRAGVRYAVRRSRTDADAIAAANLRARAVASPEEREGLSRDAEDLVADADAVRNWYAYDLPEVLVAVAWTLVAVALGLYVDLVLGSLVLAVAAATTLAWRSLRSRGEDNRLDANEAEVLRLIAEREHAENAVLARRLDAVGWLQGRLERARARADAAYLRVAGEYAAQRQLVRGALWLGLLLVGATALVRLGYAGLQTGEMFSVLILALVSLPRVPIALTSLGRFHQIRRSRLRLDEIYAAARAPLAETEVPHGAARLSLVVAGEGAPKTLLGLDLPGHLALVGPDVELRTRILANLLGESPSPVELRTQAEAGIPLALNRLGNLVVVSPGDPLVDASLAENISLSARPETTRLEEAARIAGLDAAHLLHGLATRPSELAEGDNQGVALRTLIARAVYVDADVLLLDRATEGLSAYEESVLLDSLLAWGRRKSIILSSRRALAAYGFDAVAYCAEGEIESAGAHAELMGRRGAYYYEVVTQGAPRR